MRVPVIETRDLTKKYGPFTAVDSLNLTVAHGEVFGLLGPNGAGKTTSILMLLGLTEPSSGSVSVLGLDPVRRPLSVKARVGYMPDMVGFYDELTAEDNLFYIARLNGISRGEANSRIAESLKRVGLHDITGKPVGVYSRGMRQRLGVAELLIKKPELIIMDEPTQGLDPESAREFLDLIRDLKAEGITILLASHLLYQVQAICDRVGLFNDGKMVLEGTVAELAGKVLGGAYRVQVEAEGDAGRLADALGAVPGVVSVQILRSGLYEMEAERDLRPDLAAAAISVGGRLLRLDVKAQSLEDIYARYFKEVENATVH